MVAAAPRLSPHNRSRSRSTSIIHEVRPDSLLDQADQGALPNLNANWVNRKGAWVIHVVMIASVKIFLDTIPGVSQELSWTLTNLTYMIVIGSLATS